MTDCMHVMTGFAGVLLYIGWLFFYLLVVDKHIRGAAGKFFGVEIVSGLEMGGFIGWKVTGVSGFRAVLIELMQYVFMVPAVIVPAVAGIILITR